ncbi:MAG: cation transporter [Treponema sp.]|jgi:copper chaperone CopZ|nr:cation transporter [Treponema sp.]
METTLRIEGMSCEHCAAHVKEALEGVAGVLRAAVSLKDKSALVEHNGADPAALRAAVDEAGYEIL